MAIEDGEQILPTGAFEEFDDFEDRTIDEEVEEENRINEEQELNDKDTVRLQGDPDPEDKDKEPLVDDEEDVIPDDLVLDEYEDEKKDEKEEEKDKKEKSEEKVISKKEKFERYSRSVQRRINKEVKQREILRAENAELKARIDGIENKFRQEEQQSETNVLANRIRNATSIKQQLLEDNEYEQVSNVDNDIMQMKIQQSKLEERAQQQAYQSQQGQDPQQAQEQNPQQAQEQNPQQSQVDVPSIQTQWIKGNKRFGQDKVYTNYINATYDQMLEEGYDPEQTSMYAELDKRIGREVSAAARQSKSRPQSAPTPNTASAQRSARNSGLTEADKSNMKNWGLDPTDVDVRKEWLANKRKKA